MTLSKYDTFPFGHFPIKTLSKYDTLQFGHFPILTLFNFPVRLAGPRNPLSHSQATEKLSRNLEDSYHQPSNYECRCCLRFRFGNIPLDQGLVPALRSQKLTLPMKPGGVGGLRCEQRVALSEGCHTSLERENKKEYRETR